MAKGKWKKVLFGTALLGAAIAAGIAYITKYKSASDDLDDDFDDFDDDFDEGFSFDDNLEDSSSREYVSLDMEENASDNNVKTVSNFNIGF